MARIAILGSGGWGTALAVALSNQGHTVSLWSAFEEEIQALQADREHKKLLPGVILPDTIDITSQDSCAADKEIVIIAVPSFVVRQTARRFAPILAKDTIIVNVSKGIENESLSRLSVVLQEELPNHAIVALSGPSHAEEVARDKATTLAAASTDATAAEQVQKLFHSHTLRIYTSDDIIGVELGGALKNVIAICKGILEGAGVGDNCVAAMMTRGLAEMARLGVKMGGKPMTFSGLTGVGDLIVTCMSQHSRNHRCGVLIGQGMPVQEAIDTIGMTVEGYHATATAYALAKQYEVEMPIVEQCYAVLYEGRSVEECIQELMNRPSTTEYEGLW